MKEDADLERLVLILTYGKFIAPERFKKINEFDTEKKIRIANKIVEESINIAKDLFKEVKGAILFSGSTESLIVLDLVSNYNKSFDKIDIVHINTRNEFSENEEYIKSILKKYGYIRYVEIIPKFTPEDIWKTFGLPAKKKSYYYTPACCTLLKDLPLAIFLNQSDDNLLFDSFNLREDKIEYFAPYQAGLVRYTNFVSMDIRSSRKIIRVSPIGIFNRLDVSKYIISKILKTNPVYSKYRARIVDCKVCTASRDWEDDALAISEDTYRQFIKYLSEYGLQETKKKYKELVDTVKTMFSVNSIEDLYEIKSVSI